MGKVYKLDEMPDEDFETLMQGLDEIIEAAPEPVKDSDNE